MLFYNMIQQSAKIPFRNSDQIHSSIDSNMPLHSSSVRETRSKTIQLTNPERNLSILRFKIKLYPQRNAKNPFRGTKNLPKNQLETGCSTCRQPVSSVREASPLHLPALSWRPRGQPSVPAAPSSIAFRKPAPYPCAIRFRISLVSFTFPPKALRFYTALQSS